MDRICSQPGNVASHALRGGSVTLWVERPARTVTESMVSGHDGAMKKLLKTIASLSAAKRGGLFAFVSVDLAARVAAIRDALKRDDDEIRGPKLAWIAALAIVNSGGVLPLVYRKVGVTTK